jgi:hypothetical protein
MIPYFHDLGERVGDAWRRTGRDERRFAELAHGALADAPPHAAIGVDDIAAWLLDPLRHVRQPDESPFGQPGVRVYAGHRFRIEALFWRESTTSIHQHAFAGAFAPLAGASFHSTYDFTETARINTRLRLGDLVARTMEILRPGDVRAIDPGDAFIHQVTHLVVPTVTIVVRTEGFVEHRPQLRYELPGVALDNEESDPALSRRLALIDLLAVTRRPDAIAAAQRWIAGGDVETTYHLVTHLAPHLVPDELALLSDALVERHGDAGATIAAACEHRRRVHAAVAVRARTSRPSLRLVVAALMLGCAPPVIRALLAAHDPDARLEPLLTELAEAGMLGVVPDELTVDLIGAVARGASPTTLVDALAEDYDADDLAAQAGDLVSHAQRLSTVPLLGGLFAAAGWATTEAP